MAEIEGAIGRHFQSLSISFLYVRLKEHSTKNILRCKQEIVLTLGYLRSLKGQLFLGKEELFIEVCKIPYRTTPCCLSQADA